MSEKTFQSILLAVMGRAKSMNNSVLYNVDALHAAIDSGMMVSFKYFQYNLKLEREYQRKGEKYLVSPWALIYDNNEYYLLAYEKDEFRHYRVDKMADVRQEAIERDGGEAFKEIKMADYTKSTFGMYSGEMKRVAMVFQNRMIGTVIDKFGKLPFILTLLAFSFRSWEVCFPQPCEYIILRGEV